MSNNAHDLSNRLLNALDNNYNVVDMQAVNEIISILEKFNITKELLETTRLGKHVNELRRKTSDPTLARRAKVLVKRWRDLVIPTVASPGHTGSNRSSAERQVRRLGGTPLTSPALSRVVSPAVNSPRPPSRPAWGGYESDSQDVILVDDDPPPAPAPPPPLPGALKPLTPLAPLTSPVKRPTSPVALHDEKKAKRDKKPKKRRGHSRAGSGTETPASVAPAPAPVASAPAWGARNGSSERRRNGYRRDKLDPYTALVNKIPVAGAKKVKTTKELLEEIQSRGSKPPASPASPADPASPDVMLIEPDSVLVKVESPLRNGAASPPPPASPCVPLEDEREYLPCTCGDEAEDGCPAASTSVVRPHHVTALHHTLLPGINGTRAPLFPHKFAVRPAEDPDREGLFASVVPLYKYSDYANDYCAKNMWRVPLYSCPPPGELAPPPPEPPPPPAPPEPRPYPIDPDPDPDAESPAPPPSPPAPPVWPALPVIAPELVGAPPLEPGERLKAPLLSADDERNFPREKCEAEPEPMDVDVQKEFPSEVCDHRTVERTKAPPVLDPRSPETLDGRALYQCCADARDAVPYDYAQLLAAPALSLPPGVQADAEAERLVGEALAGADADTERDALGRPVRPARFAEWHECARLGDLVALPYVVID